MGAKGKGRKVVPLFCREWVKFGVNEGCGESCRSKKKRGVGEKCGREEGV